jgi:phage terminase small subunit
MKKLTLKQRLFCEEYILTQNASASYRSAYGSTDGRHGYDLLQLDHINDYIEKIKNEEVKTVVASPKEVLSFFTDVMRDEKAYMKDRLKGAEFLAKHYNILTDKQQIELTKEITIDLGDLLD